MAKLITTKFLGATNTRGARIKATCPSMEVSVTVSYNYASREPHVEAVDALIAKMDAAARERLGTEFEGYKVIAGISQYNDGERYTNCDSGDRTGFAVMVN